MHRLQKEHDLSGHHWFRIRVVVVRWLFMAEGKQPAVAGTGESLKTLPWWLADNGCSGG